MPGPGASRATGGRRRPVARVGLIIAIGTWLLAGLLPATGWAAVTTWIVDLSPTSIDVDQPTTVDMTFANLGGPTGNDDLGCVTLVIPGAFRIGTVVVTESPPDTVWRALVGGQTVVINTSSGGDRLPSDDPTAKIVVAIGVTPNTAGQFNWTATPYLSQNCKGPVGEVATLAMVVLGKATPTPTPPTPTPTPTPTLPPGATPAPTPTAPIATPPASTPTPGASGAPLTTPNPTRGPGATASSTATPSHSTPPGVDPAGGPPPSGAPVGAGLLMPGVDSGAGGGDGGAPTIDLTTGFETPFGEGFAWAVPGLVLSVPGIFLVLAVIGAQALGAFAWLPVVRRRIGVFGIRRRPLRRRDA